MGIFDKSNRIVNTGIIEQVFQGNAKVILLANGGWQGVRTHPQQPATPRHPRSWGLTW